jgi:hypothetical protein
MGCTVDPAGKFHCPCHGSIYDAATAGRGPRPAARALAGIETHVGNREVVAGSAWLPASDGSLRRTGSLAGGGVVLVVRRGIGGRRVGRVENLGRVDGGQ